MFGMFFTLVKLPVAVVPGVRTGFVERRARRAGDELMDLRAAVAGLSRRQREAVALYYRLGLSVAETAQAMRVSDGTVKTLLSRARATLAQVLGPGEVHDA